MTARLDAQVAFLLECDRLKSVDRANLLLDGSRRENSAEHSWHLALYALILAPFSGDAVDALRAMRMLLLHDLVEIDVGDHPIHLDTDWSAVQQAEQQAADRLFGLLPSEQGANLRALWQEFEDDRTDTARFAKTLDRCQPIFQTLCADSPPSDHVAIVRDNLTSGRAANLCQEFPAAHAHACRLLGTHPSGAAAPRDEPFGRRLDFLNEADQLKQIYRASRLADGSRRENSGEHSWHIMIYAWVLQEYAAPNVNHDRVLQMLLIHDIVEIDAGDNPIHGQVDHDAVAALEQAAADRLFGLLPGDQEQQLRALWDEFEAAQTADAQFAKAVDRFQVPVLNLNNGGGTWRDYKVTLTQMEHRVGVPVIRGAPALWEWLYPQLGPALADL
ncbi:HD domain-containing protein [Rhodobacteraceae bacterium M382]|nr:HD domain-containing protein [Rhodobacteraceae bacterium M382]